VPRVLQGTQKQALLRLEWGFVSESSLVPRSNAMKKFVQQHQDEILGVLSGFDRLRLRGSLRLLQSEGGVATWLERVGVAVKDFLDFAKGLTRRLCRRADQLAEDAGRKVRYLPGVVDKEVLVQEIREKQGVADNGLVAVLSTLEMGMSYTMFRRRDNDFAVLRRQPQKCKHYYYYWEDGRFGLTQVRLSSWFPFDVHVVLNGREWLAQQMDAKGLGYLRRDNCFLEVSDFARVQKLADAQPRLDWVGQLDRVLRRVHPLHAEFFRGEGALDYYWTAEQTEWATDLVFRDAASLQALYQKLVRHGIDTFQSSDVLRFLGHQMPAHGGINGHYQGEVRSDLKRRHEGIRIKHHGGKNSVKMYNKQPTLLRIETTLNDGQGLKVYRHKDNDPEGPRQWLNLRKTVADLPRRAELSQASNQRYLDALSSISADTPLSEITDRLCRAVTVEGRRHRGLRPFDVEEVRLLQAVSRGEFLISGFRNRDVRTALYGETQDAAQRRREAGRVSRKLALLRAHGLIKKIPRTHRYLLTETGVKAIAAILAARQASLSQLAAA